MGRSPRYQTQIDGLLIVDKPVGVTSADVVRQVRFAAGNCKTGHGGTLDPLASGVLVCLLGRATKRTDRVMAGAKVYVAGVDLSAFTATDDREGEREEVQVQGARPQAEEVAGACDRFIGEIQQAPPAYSAAHVGGRRAYQMARAGTTVALGTRTVRIDHIALLDYGWPIATLEVRCGKGVYIRALARDLGRALGTGGHLASLRRTAVGPFTLEQAITLDRVGQGITADDLLPIPD